MTSGPILVVEDRDDVRRGLVQLFELHGYTVDDAPTGDEALARLMSDRYALLVLDLVLPGRIGGSDIRAHQLNDAHLSRIPTIVITAAELPDEERATLKADGWLEKPFRFGELLSLVEQYVAPQQRGTAA